MIFSDRHVDAFVQKLDRWIPDSIDPCVLSTFCVHPDLCLCVRVAGV
jgi:hypothetical protein